MTKAISNGYGMAKRDGRWQMSHRLAYEDAFGPIPPKLVVDHLCKVRNCINSDHLEAVTKAENTRRREIGPDGRCKRGHMDWGKQGPLGQWQKCKTCSKEYRLNWQRNKRAVLRARAA